MNMLSWKPSRSQTISWVGALILFGCGVSSEGFAQRAIPRLAAEHPGNIFLADEDISLPLEDGQAWTLVDYEGRTAAQGTGKNGRADVGRLPVGYYELQVDGSPRTTLGVLAPLAVPTPETSPIAIDVAMAWFYPEAERPKVAGLCALAGINWVRDRLSWGEMEPVQGNFAEPNRYDDTARCQSAAELRVLQVHHGSPSWATSNHQRFPPDLRDAYTFEREMARRWKGQVPAFEPWNEADIEVFGGHTGAEMASLQKASYLGLKAGNPDVIACMNVFASSRRATLDDLHANQAWPYFDTFNLHHYAPTDAYPQIYAAFRSVSAGRPLWVTECNVPVHWSGDSRQQEPSPADLRIQAERVATIYTSSLYEGSAQVFYFMLPHYCERQTQFGVLHKDLTPRPAFLAVAACGRILADAQPLGRLEGEPVLRAFVFRAKPDGQDRDVLVAWTQGEPISLNLPAAPIAVFDHLGRETKTGDEATIGRAPQFLVFAKETFAAAALQPPPPAAAWEEGSPSPIVLQAIWPREKVSIDRSAYLVSSEQSETIPVFVYNFGGQPARGTLRATGPEGWKIQLPAEVEIAPGGREELALTVDCGAGSSALTETVRIDGDFGPAGKPILSLRLMPQPIRLRGTGSLGLPAASEATRWQSQISADSKMKISPADGGGVRVEGQFGPGDRWIYPTLTLRDDERPRAAAGALQFMLTALEGQATYRAIFTEQNGSGYVGDVLVQPVPGGGPVEAIVLLNDVRHGDGWSAADPNGRLDPEQIAAVKIGCNTSGEHVVFSFDKLRWIELRK